MVLPFTYYSCLSIHVRKSLTESSPKKQPFIILQEDAGIVSQLKTLGAIVFMNRKMV